MDRTLIAALAMVVGCASGCCLPMMSEEKRAERAEERARAEAEAVERTMQGARDRLAESIPAYVAIASKRVPPGTPEQVETSTQILEATDEILDDLRALSEGDGWDTDEHDLTVSTLFLLANAMAKESGQSAKGIAEQLIGQMTELGLIGWFEVTRELMASQVEKQRAEARIVKVSCREAAKQMGSGSRDLTDIQRDRVFQSDYKGRAFRWPLKIVDVTSTLGMMAITANCSPRSDAYLYDLTIRVPRGQKEVAAQLSKGAVYSIEGEFSGAGDILGLSADFIRVAPGA